MKTAVRQSGDDQVDHRQPESESDDEGDDDADEDQHGEGDRRLHRSDYVGRGNVQAVRAARKKAGLNESFPGMEDMSDYFWDCSCPCCRAGGDCFQ